MRKGIVMSGKGDLIYKQDAIDALGEKPLAWVGNEYELGLQKQWQSDVNALRVLPSVQAELDTGLYTDGFVDGYNARKSETILCKDCKWSDFYAVIGDKARCYCTDNGAYWLEGDYCSRAEKEKE